MALFSLIADFLAPYELSGNPTGFYVRGTVRTGTVYSGDDILFVMPNHITSGVVESVRRDDKKPASYAASGEVVNLFFVGIPIENVKDAVQNDASYGITWLSLGLISASAPIADDKAIDELRNALPNPRLLIELQRDRVIEITQSYLSVLLQKYDQLTYVDEYDTVEIGNFEKEVSRFIGKKLTDVEVSFAKPIVIELVLKAHQERGAKCADFEKNMSPFEYESFCADQLKRSGWTAKVTKRSGDQGCDIIAEKDGRRIVIQCKLYSQPVGNKAVQEVFAAQEYNKANAAYVVSNAPFTKSAYQLASSLKVELIHHECLNDL